MPKIPISRRERRTLLRRGERKHLATEYTDNLGNVYDYKWVARIGSFFNLFFGCLRNGFPIAVPLLWYPAWAFYPFFLIRRNLRVKDPIPILNHERIHIRQQRDLHIVISFPLLVLSLFAWLNSWFNPLFLLVVVPFIPTLAYMLDFVVTWLKYVIKRENYTITKIRENTCFEREAISKCLNADYILERRFFAVIAYTDIKLFQKYRTTKN